MSNGSQAGTLVSLGWAGPQISIEEGTLFIPWLAAVTLVLDILELAGIIPDPIALLLSMFAGRPREQASLQQAQRLMSARNPAARLAGIQLERMVKEWDIVTSEGGSGRSILDAWASQFVGNLVSQGVALERARQILVHATSEAAQSGLALEPELKQPLPGQLGFNGPQDVADALMTQYENAIKAGLSINQALQKAEGWVWKHIGLQRLFKLQIGPFIPVTPPPNTLIPGQNGTCPNGYQLDPTTELCTLIPQTQPPPPPPGPIPPTPGGQPDPEGDEITDDLCAQMGANTAALISAIQGIQIGAPGDPACCANIVDAITNVVTTLGSIASAVAGLSGAGGVDLSGVVSALGELTAAVQAISAAPPVNLAGVVDALNGISTHLAKGAGVDLQPIVDQLKLLVSEGDIAQSTFQYLQQGGFLTPDELQFYQGMGWADALFTLIKRIGYDLSVGFLRIFGYDLTTGKPYTRTLGTDTGQLFADSFKAWVNGNDSYIEPLIANLVGQLKTFIAPPETPPVGQAGVSVDAPIAFATSVAITAAIASYFTSFWGLDIGEPLAHLAELLATAVSFEELRDVQIGPLIRNGVAKVAEMNARALFQQELPGNGEIMGWVARELLDPARADQLEALNGLHFSLRGPAQQAAYHGLQARMMVRAWESGLFSQGDLADELTFSGMRPASQKRMLLLAPWLATQSERKQLESALENAYVNGLLGDMDLNQQLAQLDQETDRNALVMARVQLQKRVAFAKELERSYSQQFTIGLLPEAQYRGLLAGLGLQDDWINAKVAADTAHMIATAYRKELAAELALERATAAEERKAALKNFTSGNIDAVGLAAALALTGLNPAQAVAWVDLAVLQKAGGLRWTFGLQLPPPAATLLRSRVTALSDQRKRQQITDPQFVASLQALGIPQHYVNVIRATADAMISPKTAAVTIPVETT